jgi:hypothetical protein
VGLNTPQETRSRTLVVPVDIDRMCIALALGAATLCVVGVLTNIGYATSDRAPDRFQRFVDLNAEGNLPTWYSVVLLASSAAAVAAVAAQRRARRRPDASTWFGLAAVVALMSLDEMVSLHEAAGHVLDDHVDVPLLGKYAWIVPGTAAAIAAAMVLLRAVRSLPLITRQRLVGAATVFVGSALGIEVLEALLLNDGHNYLGDGMHILTGTQECLEMAGVILFLRAMLGEVRRISASAVTA